MPKTAKAGYHHGALRGALMDQAPDLIIEVGLERFTIRELARRIGVTHTAAYRHFKTKEELLSAVALHGHDSFAKALRRARCAAMEEVATPQIEHTLTAMTATYVKWSLSHQGHYSVMFGPRLNESGQHPQLEEAIEASFHELDLVFLNFGFKKRRARELSVGLMTFVHGYLELVRLKRIRVANRRAIDNFLAKIMSPYIAGVMAEID